MAQYFLKLSGSNNIESIIEWDGVSPYTPPPGYVIELVTTTASINYAPSSSQYQEPIFGGKLFGEFSGELTGSITINGQTIDEILNETPYGTLTLYSSSMRNTSIKSGSFKINDTSSLFLPLVNNGIKYYNYSSSISLIEKNTSNNSYSNQKIILKNKENPYTKLIFPVSSIEVTSSVSASISNSFYKVTIDKLFSYFKSSDTEIKITDFNNFEEKLSDYYGIEWHIDFQSSDASEIVNSNKLTKYGRLSYNSHSINTDPGSGYFSINSSTIWSEATELYVSLENYEKNIETSSSKYELYNSTINDLFYEKIIGSKIKLESDVLADNTYKIFEINDILFVTSSGNNYAKLKVTEKSSHTSGLVLLSLGQKFNVDFEFLNKNKKQIDVITGSKSFYTPYWAKEIIVMTIGAGGGGGGGIDAKSNHYFSVGGAGGGGGSISYSQFKELSGSIRIDCFVGKAGLGGNSGSGNVFGSNNYLCITCSFDYSLPQYEQFNIIDTVPPILSSSYFYPTIFDILDDYVPTASSGMSGESTSAYVYNINVNTGEENFLGTVSAPGGVGGSGGYSLGITGSLSSSLVYDLIVSNSIYPFSVPGGTNLNLQKSIGEETFYGGPGGHGITLNMQGSSLYQHYAPSLPWGTGKEIDDLPSLLVLPFGRNIFASRRNDENIDINAVLIKRSFVSNNKSTIIPIGTGSSTYFELSYDKPSNIGPTGGGGGTGWIASNLVVTSSLTTGSSGKLIGKNSLFEYPISVGGNGGNTSVLGNLQLVLPQPATGPGAGGGGGASDAYNGNPQNGENGGSGAVVIISMG